MRFPEPSVLCDGWSQLPQPYLKEVPVLKNLHGLFLDSHQYVHNRLVLERSELDPEWQICVSSYTLFTG